MTMVETSIDSKRYLSRPLEYLLSQAYLSGYDWRELLQRLEREYYGGRVPSYDPLPELLGPTPSARLKEARLMRGARQVDLAPMRCETAENISRYETGVRDLMRARVRTILEMARGLRCHAVDFCEQVLGIR